MCTPDMGPMTTDMKSPRVELTGNGMSLTFLVAIKGLAAPALTVEKLKQFFVLFGVLPPTPTFKPTQMRRTNKQTAFGRVHGRSDSRRHGAATRLG